MLSLLEGLSTADSNSAPAKEIMELFGLLYQQSIITLLYLTRQLEKANGRQKHLLIKNS